MSQQQLTPDEIVRRGNAIYASQIRPQLTDEDHGKFVVIDVESGDFEICTEHVTAIKKMLANHEGNTLYSIRIGHPAAYKLGGSRIAELT